MQQPGLALMSLVLTSACQLHFFRANCRSSNGLDSVAACRDIAYGNGWLVACSLVHMGLAVVLVRSHGAVGLIAADAVNMALRIAFCLAFVARHFRGVPSFKLTGLFPSRAALTALAAASLVCLAADSVLFKGTALPKNLQVCHCRTPESKPFLQVDSCASHSAGRIQA